MTVEQDGDKLECEFRHLSLAEYMTALHVHVTGAELKGFPRDRKELILQYLSGLASPSNSKDQMVVKDFLVNMGSTHDARDSMDYLKFVQKMKGEWYNQQGRNQWSLIPIAVGFSRLLENQAVHCSLQSYLLSTCCITLFTIYIKST